MNLDKIKKFYQDLGIEDMSPWYERYKKTNRLHLTRLRETVRSLKDIITHHKMKLSDEEYMSTVTLGKKAELIHEIKTCETNIEAFEMKIEQQEIWFPCDDDSTDEDEEEAENLRRRMILQIAIFKALNDHENKNAEGIENKMWNVNPDEGGNVDA